jgi:hypothetical protein
MEFIMKIPGSIFRTAKTPEEVAREMRLAAAVFWVARGDVTPEAVSAITMPSPPEPAPEKAPEKAPGFKAFLRSMPDVGQDADFERPLDYGRPVPEWDT